MQENVVCRVIGFGAWFENGVVHIPLNYCFARKPHSIKRVLKGS